MLYNVNVVMTVDKWFLILAITFGILLIIVTPPFQAPDEYNHYYRAIGISNGDLVPIKINKSQVVDVYDSFPGANTEISNQYVGSYISEDVIKVARGVSRDLPGNTDNKQSVQEIFKYLKYGEMSENKIFASYPNTSLYSPVPYTPSVLAVLIGRLLHTPHLITFYLARLFHLFAYISLVYFAIKTAPYLKNTLFLLGLMPVSLFLGMSVSADTLVISLSFLTFALISKLYKSYSKKTFYVLVLVSFLLGMSKSGYFLLPAMSLILFVKYRKVKLFLPVIASVYGLFLWQGFIDELYVPLRYGVDMNDQLELIIQEPVNFIKVLANTVVGNRNYIVTQFVGNLGWLDVPLNMYVCYFYVLLLIISTVFDVSYPDNRLKIMSFLVAVVSFLIISVLMYLSWSPVGHHEILGLVGKNFIPLSIFGLAVFGSSIGAVYSKITNDLWKYFIVCILIYTLIKLIYRYYVTY